MSDLLQRARMKRVLGRLRFQADIDIQRERLREAILKFMGMSRITLTKRCNDWADAYVIHASCSLPVDVLKFGRAGRGAFVDMMTEAIHTLSEELARKILDTAMCAE